MEKFQPSRKRMQWFHSLKNRQSKPIKLQIDSLTFALCSYVKKNIVEGLTQFLLSNNINRTSSMASYLVDQCYKYGEKSGCLDKSRGSAIIDVVYVDYGKEFDLVPHHRLLRRLERFGIRNNYCIGQRTFQGVDFSESESRVTYRSVTRYGLAYHRGLFQVHYFFWCILTTYHR